MRKIAFVFVSLLLPLMAAAQNQKDTIRIVSSSKVLSEDDQIFYIVENMPEYPGGDNAKMQFLKDNLKYTKKGRKKGIEGMVYIRFVVEKDGSISNPKILRDIGGGLGDEALRVVKLMPKWIPGILIGEAVRCYETLPIKFVL